MSAKTQPGTVADALYRMVLDGRLYIDLERAIVDEASKCRVFVDALDASTFDRRPGIGSEPLPMPVTLSEGERLVWDGRVWEIQNVGQTRIALGGEPTADGAMRGTEVERSQFEALVARGSIRGVAAPPESRMAAARERRNNGGPEGMANARLKFDRIVPVLDGLARSSSLSRNEKRWVAIYRAAEREYGDGFVGLIPLAHPGNRKNHAVVVPDDPIDHAIDADYAQPQAPGKMGLIRRVYARLIEDGWSESGLPSARRIRERLRRSKTHGQDVARYGKRAAYASEALIWRLSATSPPHGTRPWERVHIDHTQLDVELVDSENRDLVLGRPWLTVMIDAFSRRVLAAWLTFDPPSYRSDMMDLRLCVRRYNRLPQELIADGGADFESVYYESFLASTRITKMTRPAAKGHYGSVIERLFGLTDQIFIHEVVGNTKATKSVRTMTPQVDPRRLAAFDLETFYEALCEWFYEVYDTRLHPTLGKTPRQAYAVGIELSGSRRARYWNYDEDFILLTMPTKGKGRLSIHPTHGLRLDNRHYWHDKFHDPRLHRKSVPFVFDPWDMRYLRVFVDGGWIRCAAPAFTGLPAISERELMMAATEATGRDQAVGRARRSSDIEIGRLLRDVDRHGAELTLQRRQDAAARRAAEAIGLIEPASPPLVADGRLGPASGAFNEPSDVAFGPASVPVVDFGDYE